MSKPLILIVAEQGTQLREDVYEKLSSLNLLNDFEILSLKQIEEKFNLDPNTVTKFLSKHNIPNDIVMHIKDADSFLEIIKNS